MYDNYFCRGQYKNTVNAIRRFGQSVAAGGYTGMISTVLSRSDHQWAYSAVEKFVRQRSRTFRVAAAFLPPATRPRAWATYAFFRRLDDWVDNQQISLDEFHLWRKQAMRPAAEQSDPILAAWADVCESYTLNREYIQDLLDGIEMDLTSRRYETLEELFDYCRHIASGGLLALSMVQTKPGVTFVQAKPSIVGMTVAVQMTDILCDVGEDLQQGRIYLPGAELKAFGLSYHDIENQIYDERFKRLMRQCVQVTRALYVENWQPMLVCFTGVERLASGVCAIWFRSLLDEIERVNFDTFRHRVKISFSKKLWLLATKWPAILWPETANRFFKTSA